jgi:uncharacterized membrane protein YraQ (UPF0718 family)
MIDPICGMTVDEGKGIKATKAGKDYFFCSTYCRDKFIGRAALFKNKVFIVISVAILLLLVSFFLPILVPFRNIFLIYVKKIWWAVTLGLGLGGVIDHYVPREYISKILSGRKPTTIFNAVIIGFLMSACSHGILALSVQLHKKGASNPAVISFLLASPWANIAITLMLLSLFGLKGVFIILSAIIIAINTGLIFMFLEKKGLIEKNKNTVEVTEGFSILKDVKARAKEYKFNYVTIKDDAKGVLRGAAALSNMVLWWIIIGMLIASFAGAYIPVHFFHRFMGPTVFGLVVTLALATIIEVCSEGSSPLAFEIYRQTGALGNSFVFLMAGVVTDYTEIGLLWTNVGRRVALWLPVVAVPQVLILGYIANIIFT